MVELVAERGYDEVTVRGLARAAGVSTRTFYKHFANAEECFASTYASLTRCALRQTADAARDGEDWERNLRAGLRALLQALAGHPKAAHLALVDSFAAGPAMLRQMRLAVREFERLLVAALAEAPDQAAVPPRIIRGMAAGVLHTARERLLAGRASELPEIAGELGDWMLSLRGAHAVEREDGAGPSAAVRSGGPGERGDLKATLPSGIGNERGRILTAAAKLGASQGYWALTVPKIRAEASVSRRSFDAEFGDVGDCLLEAIEVLVVSATVRAERRAVGAVDWEARVQQATAVLCGEVARRPVLAQLAFVEIYAPGRAGLNRRERLVALGADRLRRTAPAHRRPSRLAAEASMAAAWRIVQTEVDAGRGRALPRIAPTIAYVLVAPGGENATAATRVAAAARQSRQPRNRDPN